MLANVMKARFEADFLSKLMAIWPHPKTGDAGITVYILAKETGISQQTIHTWIEVHKEETSKKKQKSEPSLEYLRRLDRYFKIIEFVPDGNNRIDNDLVLENVKAFLETHVYKKAVA